MVQIPSLRRQLTNITVDVAPISTVRERLYTTVRVKDELKKLKIDESLVFTENDELRPIFQSLKGESLRRVAMYFAYILAMRNLRRRFKLSQVEVAKELGVSATEFSYFETGIKVMDMLEFEAYLWMFQLDTGDYSDFKSRHGTAGVEDDDFPFDDLREHFMHHPPRFED